MTVKELITKLQAVNLSLCLDATRMVNKIFQADAEWLKKMAEKEIRQREGRI